MYVVFVVVTPTLVDFCNDRRSHYRLRLMVLRAPCRHLASLRLKVPNLHRKNSTCHKAGIPRPDVATRRHTLYYLPTAISGTSHG